MFNLFTKIAFKYIHIYNSFYSKIAFEYIHIYNSFFYSRTIVSFTVVWFVLKLPLWSSLGTFWLIHLPFQYAFWSSMSSLLFEATRNSCQLQGDHFGRARPWAAATSQWESQHIPMDVAFLCPAGCPEGEWHQGVPADSPTLVPSPTMSVCTCSGAFSALISQVNMYEYCSSSQGSAFTEEPLVSPE